MLWKRLTASAAAAFGLLAGTSLAQAAEPNTLRLRLDRTPTEFAAGMSGGARTLTLEMNEDEAQTLAVRGGGHGGGGHGGGHGGFHGGGHGGFHGGGHVGGFRGGHVGGFRGGYVGGFRGGRWGGWGGNRGWGYGGGWGGRGWGWGNRGWGWGGYWPYYSYSSYYPYYYSYYSYPNYTYYPYYSYYPYYNYYYPSIVISSSNYAAAPAAPPASTYSQAPPAPNGSNYAQPPQNGSSNGTYPYDGGPANPVPMPQAAPLRPKAAPSQPTVPLEGRSVSLPAPSRTQAARFAYPAYGDAPTRTGFAQDRVLANRSK